MYRSRGSRAESEAEAEEQMEDLLIEEIDDLSDANEAGAREDLEARLRRHRATKDHSETPGALARMSWMTDMECQHYTPLPGTGGIR